MVAGRAWACRMQRRKVKKLKLREFEKCLNGKFFSLHFFSFYFFSLGYKNAFNVGSCGIVATSSVTHICCWVIRVVR